ncbi:glycosyltransferase family 2 protein [Rhodobacter maris]|uniref:Glycosyl transferase family 2 n=1 Tax=Rhodobacter maris TaxID=446682 RepID=A0A285T2R5_9RHOB|nr:glycosyltransferase family 2 protein [Rhodobacter maris]SOC15225.1 glycosyl transferase family 2 [Rhodobacter maris]
MTIVANIQVGNEVELIDQHIAYHLALGIDGFVIADMASVDGTSERLERYRGDRRFVIRKYEMSALVDATVLRTAEIGDWMLAASRDHFAPDWVVRLDADEFLYAARPLEAALPAPDTQASFQIARRNAIFQDGQPIPPPPSNPEALAAFSIVAKPVKTSPSEYESDDSLPLIMTEVAPKVLARPDRVAAYAPGGHGTCDTLGQRQISPLTNGLLLVHFWFTTPGRFVRKARFTVEAKALLNQDPKSRQAWQWSRWAGLAEGEEAESEAAILQEYRRQFPGAAKLDALRQAGIVRRVGEYWDA